MVTRWPTSCRPVGHGDTVFSRKSVIRFVGSPADEIQDTAVGPSVENQVVTKLGLAYNSYINKNIK